MARLFLFNTSCSLGPVLRVAGIDIGGTFVDVAVLEGDVLRIFKVPTSVGAPERSALEVINMVGGVDEVVHATTIATNALLGQVGLELPRVALITTKGFRDVIEIGRQNRPRLYDLFFDKPRPLVPRELRIEVEERVDPWGRVLKPLSPGEAAEAAEKARLLGAGAVAISFLHSYANPSNELVAEQAARRLFEHVSVSHKVAPEPREYERTSTAVVNAALMPIVSKYLERLRRGLEDLGVRRLHIMSSSGGLVDAGEASERPVQIIESGPAAGVVASLELARSAGIPRAISFDMGGTTAKAGVIVEYEISITTEYEVGGEAHHGRIVKGSGYPARFPFVDLAEVSAGGGSIVWRDEAGALRVGPLSAGSEPGPMCYGRGGKRPTITDANLVLGRIGDLLGGSLKLSKSLALEGLSALGEPGQVAREAVALASLEMARAIRLVTVERGLDPSEHALIAFGGAGPQHAVEIAEELGIRRVVIPPDPGVFTAVGLLAADWRFEARSSYPEDLEQGFRSLEEALARRVSGLGEPVFARYADARYEGQGWELTVPVARPARREDLVRAFEEKHEAAYGFRLGSEVEVVTIRVFAIVRRGARIFRRVSRGSGRPAPRGSRRAYIMGEDVVARIYWRGDLGEGDLVEGPAIVEEYSSTALVPSGWAARVGGLGEIYLEPL